MDNYKREAEESYLLNSIEASSINLRKTYFSPLAPGSLRASIFALICVTLGSGMLPLPYFFKRNGIFLSLIIFLFCGFCTLFTLKILLELAHKNKIYVYNDLVGIYFNRNHMVTYSIIVLLINSLGSIIAWNVIILNFLKEILHYFNIYHQNYPYYISLLILCLILIPISTYQTISKFYIVSTIGIIQILYVVFVVLIEFPMYFKENIKTWKFKVQFFYDHFNFLSFIEMHLNFIIAFGNHSTLLSVVDEIKNKTSKRVMEVGTGTFYSELFIYLIIMFFSYFSTFNHTKQVFLDRPHQTILLLFAHFFLITLMICNQLLYYYMLIPMLQIGFNNDKKFTLLQNFFYSTFILTVLIVISFYINNIVNAFSFIAASAQVSFIFIIPFCVYIKANPGMSIFKKIIIICGICYFAFIGLMFFVYYFKNYIHHFFDVKLKE
jgi:amino acid permease